MLQVLKRSFTVSLSRLNVLIRSLFWPMISIIFDVFTNVESSVFVSLRLESLIKRLDGKTKPITL